MNAWTPSITVCRALEALTMRRLADANKLQLPSIYWVFGNKQALLDETREPRRSRPRPCRTAANTTGRPKSLSSTGSCGRPCSPSARARGSSAAATPRSGTV
ncbi:TetR/AcrR family transcriptional regulator [Streptomyces sp. AD2-2]|nr:TetR/AcrR family transcriptional regulator [Streptomyces sp. AD2-2]